MRGYVTCIVLVALLGTTDLSRAGVNMKHIEDGRFRIYYSGNSGEIAERLMDTRKRSYPILKDMFRADHDLGLEIYWADRADWSNIPSFGKVQNYLHHRLGMGKLYEAGRSALDYPVNIVEYQREGCVKEPILIDSPKREEPRDSALSQGS